MKTIEEIADALAARMIEGRASMSFSEIRADCLHTLAAVVRMEPKTLPDPLVATIEELNTDLQKFNRDAASYAHSLRVFGQHLMKCRKPTGGKCTCGWQKIRDKLDGK